MPNKTAKDAPKTLPPGAAKIWAGAFNGAYDGTCADEGERRDECAARVAWGAVKEKYERKGKTWVRKSGVGPDWNDLPLAELESHFLADFIVTKTSSTEGELRWAGRASDTLEDNLGTRMSKSLFMNFMRRSETYGMPYLSVAHYGALGGKGVAGTTHNLWIDGEMFKARGLFSSSSLGLALYGALNTERSDQTLDPDTRIRLSLGFLDLMHTHGDKVFTRASLYEQCPDCEEGNLPDVFMDGILIHFAATRIPINTRTALEIEPQAAVMRSDAILTRFEDASSIVGEALAQELESATRDNENHPDRELSESVVVLSDSQTEVEEGTTPNRLEEEITMSGQTDVLDQETEAPEDTQAAPDTEQAPETEDQAPETETGDPQNADENLTLTPQVLQSASDVAGGLREALQAFSTGVMETMEQPGLSRSQRLEALQPMLNDMSEALVASAELASQDPQTQMIAAFRSAIREEFAPITQHLQQLVLGVGLAAQPSPNSGRRTHNAAPNFNLRPIAGGGAQAQSTEPPSQFRSLARNSVGLEQENQS